MKRQTPDYWRHRMAGCVERRKMHMEDARWANSQCDDDAMQFHIGMAEDASWELRYCKRELRKLEQVAA